MDTGPAV